MEGLGPVLDALAAPGGVEVIGTDPADAQTVKLLSNLLWFGQVIAVTEALLLGRAMGLEPATLRALLATRAGSSVVLERDYEAVLRGDYMASFSLDRVIEQLATASALATELHVPFELSTLVEKTHRAAREAFGPIAGELLAARLLEERDGRALRA
ncbi:NAD-binding protein [uncultured Microbacterium sp.]|uniref:NAD-binding protein n=1 Tax=uncultured Microbacterium sp. TaxID=191216 RepID=UPI0035CC99EA